MIRKSDTKNGMQKTVCFLFLLLLANNIYALNIIPSNSHYYYKLGGGSNISMPPVTEQQEIKIGGDINTNLGFTCDGFNPAVSISNTINNIKDSFENLEGDVVNSATSAVGSFPMYLLEKASPELYNLIQNAVEGAMDTFHISLKSCQTALDQIKQNKSPYQDWFSVSDSQGWLNYAKSAQQGQDVDANSAKKEITKDPQKYGVPWVHKGQNSGGTSGDQMPIKVIYDVIVAGYNAMIDDTRSLDSKEDAPKTSELSKFWKNPDEAGKWAQLVLGDITISAKENEDETHPGVGLVTILRTCPNNANNDLTCAKNIKQKIIDIITNGGYPSSDDLKKISTNEMMITPEVISSIKNRTNEEQAIAVSKIGEDAAIQNLVDEALLLRRILIAGSQTKPVHNLKPALLTIQRTITDLDQDIKNLLFENQIRNQLVSKTLFTVLNTETSQKTNAILENEKTQEPLMQNGATYKGENQP